MKKLIPVVLGVWTLAMVGCTTTKEQTTTTSTTTRQKQTSASMDPSVDMNRTERMPSTGPR